MRALNGMVLGASLGFFVAACADGTGPGAAGGLSAAKSSTQSATPVTDTTNSTTNSGGASTAVLTPLKFVSWAPRLESYDTSFTVVQGKATADTLFFRAVPPYLPRTPYMILTIPSSAQFVDASGNPVRKGTAVRLTVQADSQFIELDFGPHGSTFTKVPATVQVFWPYIDLGGMWGGNLQLWYQPDASYPWSALTTQVNLNDMWLTSELYHFSNYAVAYRKK